MKKKFIQILEKYKLKLVSYEHSKPTFDDNNYCIEYEDLEGYLYPIFEMHTDIWDEDENSITNKIGILKYFEKCIIDNTQ